jgi:phospholipid transport system substrate-binding protein
MKSVWQSRLRVFLATGTLLAAGLVASAGAFAAQVDDTAPAALIKTLTADILATVQADPSIKGASPERLAALVKQRILPYADFEKTTRLAMGRGWAQASPEQRHELVTQFQLLLIRTYSGATSKIGDQQVSVDPVRMAPGDTDVVVQTKILSQGKAYDVGYRVEKTAAGWRLYDVNVLGVWLIQAYRQQFADLVSSSGVAGLLSFLVERNRQLAGGAPAAS